MAEKLMRYYQYVDEEVGLAGKLKLAQLTKTPSTLAATHPDSEEILQRFQEAVKGITGKEAPRF